MATAIIPVKRFQTAKQRLASAVPLRSRSALAEAMFRDVLAALEGSSKIEQAIVVTADRAVARIAREHGVEGLERKRDAGHSQDAVAGIELALSLGESQVVLLPGDCPLLDAAELDRHLGSGGARSEGVAALIVPDRHGTGTNALVLSPPDALVPSFGPDSCARHANRARAAGVSFAVRRLDSLALDLDTPEDLDLLRDALVSAPERAPLTAQLILELGSDREAGAPTVA